MYTNLTHALTISAMVRFSFAEILFVGGGGGGEVVVRVINQYELTVRLMLPPPGSIVIGRVY